MDYRPFITIAEEWVLEQIDFPPYTEGDTSYTLLDKGIILSVARNGSDELNGTVEIDPDRETDLDFIVDVYAYSCVEAMCEGEVVGYEERDPRYQVHLYASVGVVEAGTWGESEVAVVHVAVDESLIHFDSYVEGSHCHLFPKS